MKLLMLFLFQWQEIGTGRFPRSSRQLGGTDKGRGVDQCLSRLRGVEPCRGKCEEKLAGGSSNGYSANSE